MRILIAADIFPPDSGGPATYAVTLANEFAKRKIGVEIVSLNPNSERSAISCSVFPVHSRNKILRYVEYLRLLYARAKDADAVYAMGPVNAGLPALLAARLRRKKFVVKVVGDYAWEQGVLRFGVKEMVGEFQKKIYVGMVGLLRCIERFVARHADEVIVPAEYLRLVVLLWGVPQTRVSLIYNTVEFQSAYPMPKQNGERWIVSVGRLVRWKGFDTLIEIMKELSAQFHGLQLKIVGGGPDMEALQSQVQEMNLGGIVELVGNVPHEKALSYIRAADVFVLNSGYEGLSHVVLEAMSYEIPIFASRVGGNPEVMMWTETGDLFTYNNKEEIRAKLAEYLKTGAARKGELPFEKRKEFFERFDLKMMVSKTKAVFDHLCASS